MFLFLVHRCGSRLPLALGGERPTAMSKGPPRSGSCSIHAAEQPVFQIHSIDFTPDR